MFVKTTNGQIDKYPYTVGQLRRDNPQTSFPKKVPDELLAEYGVLSVTLADNPTFDPLTHRMEQAQEPSLVNGVWTLTKSVVALTAEEIASATERKASEVRSKRDSLIAATDYLALSDTTLTAEMAAYRQALRDITDHASFPYLADTDWPVKP